MAEVERLQQKIRFFEASGEAKENIAKSESERLRLEIELDRMINSEDALAKSKALKLKKYFEKLCEDEAKSVQRNQQLLVDLKRVDEQFLHLETKLDRLSAIKKEMETFFKTAYPKWTNENRLFEANVPPGSNLGQTVGSIGQPAADHDDRNSTRTINALMEVLRPKNENRRPASPTKKSATSAKKSDMTDLVPPANKYVKNLVQLAAAEARANTMRNEELLQSGTINVPENNLIKEYEQEIKRRDSNMIDFNASSTINLNQLNASNEFVDAKANVLSSDASRQQLETGNKNGSTLRQDLNPSGLFYLLDFIELEISHAIHPEKFYRQVEPHYKNKLEIIRLARESRQLNQVDPTEASMVVLDQLPIVIDKNTKNKCLFTRDLLGLSVADINEQLVAKSLRDESDKRLWRRLVKHWTILQRGSKIPASVLARLFAPTLIGYSNPTAAEKAVQFAEKIINDCANLEASGPLSESKTDKSLTETSINQELLMASSSKLKESSVYQDFIQGTQSSGKSKQVRIQDSDDDDDDDENDDINDLVAPKPVITNGNSSNKSKSGGGIHILRSPRATNDYDFDFSQHSISDSQKIPKVLQSLRSSGEREKLPVHLRNLDSDDDSDLSYENSKSKPKSDADYDFYH